MEDDVNFDAAEDCDYNNLKKRIADILRQYFQYDDTGFPNDKYDPNYTASNALDDIHEIIGDI